jgi:ribosome biogenesis protein MAK21
LPAPPVLAKTASESKSKHRHAKFIVDPVSHWHTALPPLPASTKPLDPITPPLLSSLSTKAQRLHSSDSELYQSTSAALPSSSDVKFLSQILSSGTLSDRLSALTLLVQGSPVHNTKALDTLRSMAERGKGSGGRGESLKALRCIVDWWVGGGTPGRKLK